MRVVQCLAVLTALLLACLFAGGAAAQKSLSRVAYVPYQQSNIIDDGVLLAIDEESREIRGRFHWHTHLSFSDDRIFVPIPPVIPPAEGRPFALSFFTHSEAGFSGTHVYSLGLEEGWRHLGAVAGFSTEMVCAVAGGRFAVLMEGPTSPSGDPSRSFHGLLLLDLLLKAPPIRFPGRATYDLVFPDESGRTVYCASMLHGTQLLQTLDVSPLMGVKNPVLSQKGEWGVEVAEKGAARPAGVVELRDDYIIPRLSSPVRSNHGVVTPAGDCWLNNGTIVRTREKGKLVETPGLKDTIAILYVPFRRKVYALYSPYTKSTATAKAPFVLHVFDAVSRRLVRSVTLPFDTLSSSLVASPGGAFLALVSRGSDGTNTLNFIETEKDAIVSSVELPRTEPVPFVIPWRRTPQQ